MEKNSLNPELPAVPEILAPAGDLNSFLAALAAGADAVYLGLKQFSARMEAENFGIGELARMSDLAHANGKRIYVAMNGLLKQNELSHAFRLLRRLVIYAPVDELIVQDLAMLDISRQAGFEGGLSFSTLANITSPEGLAQARLMGANRVVLPRELSLDEIRVMGDMCPQGLDLECFVHGALCYCVSGRCYWSSYMGGKSGLRGRCVQPCRRVYSKGKASSNGDRYFSCQDLKIGSIVKTLLKIPNLKAWKIEGRKKGAHYVFYTVRAYRLLRDEYEDSSARKMAESFLDMALGRPGVKARFLPQNPSVPMAPGKQTASGLFTGKLVTGPEGICELKTRHDLIKGDYLRIGTEDERWHATIPVTRPVPKGGILPVRLARHKTPKTGTPVFLVDRREPELQALIEQWRKKLDSLPLQGTSDITEHLALPEAARHEGRPDMRVGLSLSHGRIKNNALWLSARTAEISRPLLAETCFWLPPVIWPDDEAKIGALIERVWKNGARHFVCNAPWQRGFFPDKLPANADLVAGPFCNIANSLAIFELGETGFRAAIISPELPKKEILELPGISPLPLGMVIEGFWPVGISRFGLNGINVNEMFYSPKGEGFWAKNYGGNIWVYPAWPLDLKDKKQELLKAGYSFFVTMEEKRPESEKRRDRPGLFNWEGQLL